MGVAAEYQHRVLFWGVLGALVMRGVFILAGVQLVRHFHGILYVFAVFLLIMGVRFLFQQGKKFDPAHSRVIRLARKLFPDFRPLRGRAILYAVRRPSLRHAAPAGPDHD